jgi:hypothetical protein
MEQGQGLLVTGSRGRVITGPLLHEAEVVEDKGLAP